MDFQCATGGGASCLRSRNRGASMSAKLFETDVKFLQRFLKVAGVYQGPVDGKWSAAVDTAETAFSDQYVAIRSELGTFDNRSESNIVTLLPAAQRKARAFL